MRRSTLLCLVGLFLLLAATHAFHAQLNRGALEGIVTDQQGAVIPGVEITVTNTETNVSSTTKTNSAGYYRVESLVPGGYSAHFVFGGFSPLDIKEIQVVAGRLIRTDAQMQVGTSLQKIEVNAAPPLLETAAANAST